MTPEQLLRAHAFTSDLTDSQVAKLASFARSAVFEADQTILFAGERSRYFYLLISGSVSVEVRTRFCTVRVQAVAPGEAFGWSALLQQHDTLFEVRARELSTVLCLDGEHLSAAFQEDPMLGLILFKRALEVVAGRVKATESKMVELYGLNNGPARQPAEGPRIDSAPKSF